MLKGCTVQLEGRPKKEAEGHVLDQKLRKHTVRAHRREGLTPTQGCTEERTRLPGASCLFTGMITIHLILQTPSWGQLSVNLISVRALQRMSSPLRYENNQKKAMNHWAV